MLLRDTVIDFLTLMNIIFATLLLFAVGTLNFSAVMMRRSTDINEFGVYLRLSKTAGLMTPIATLFVAVFGIRAAEEIGFPLDERWLIASYVATAVAVLVPVATLKPWGQAAASLMPRAMLEGRILDE